MVYVGANYSQNQNHGMFYVNYTSLTNTSANHGSRHLLEAFSPNDLTHKHRSRLLPRRLPHQHAQPRSSS